MTQPSLPTRLTPLLMILLVLFVLTMQGCGGGGGGPVVDADPAGYYTNTGTASVDNGAGGTTSIDDLQAIVNGNRIMMMSTANELLYDGAITNISGNDFTADFTIYTEGENPLTATASGMITQGSRITGTLTGSGVGSRTFSLLYATTNNEVADISRIKNGSIGGGGGCHLGGRGWQRYRSL